MNPSAKHCKELAQCSHAHANTIVLALFMVRPVLDYYMVSQAGLGHYSKVITTGRLHLPDKHAVRHHALSMFNTH